MNVTWGTLLKHALLALVVAVVANLGLTLASRAMLGMPETFEPMQPLAPVLSTTLYLVLGTIVLCLVARFSKRPVRLYWIIASVALVLSFIPNALLAMDPSSQPGATPAAMVVLAAQHVVAFAIYVPWVTRVLGRTGR